MYQQKLNAATMRETHHAPSPFTQISIVPAHIRKTVHETGNGDHSHFSSHTGHRYGYHGCGAGIGIPRIGDWNTRRFDDIAVNKIRKTRCIDDSLLWDDSRESSFRHTVDYISRCVKIVLYKVSVV